MDVRNLGIIDVGYGYTHSYIIRCCVTPAVAKLFLRFKNPVTTRSSCKIATLCVMSLSPLQLVILCSTRIIDDVVLCNGSQTATSVSAIVLQNQ
jgi:hypothetical protein